MKRHILSCFYRENKPYDYQRFNRHNTPTFIETY